MTKIELVISPRTKVGELLDTYPQLENVLLELSPSFAKLKNPILRKTVARVASLQQAAIIGNLKVDELVNRLRKEVGQGEYGETIENSEYFSTNVPEWYKHEFIAQRFDAVPVINSGGSPMADVLGLASQLKTGQILELKTPFLPAPIIDMLKNKGFKVFSEKAGEMIVTYIHQK